jgi:hypothetical protein
MSEMTLILLVSGGITMAIFWYNIVLVQMLLFSKPSTN